MLDAGAIIKAANENKDKAYRWPSIRYGEAVGDMKLFREELIKGRIKNIVLMGSRQILFPSGSMIVFTIASDNLDGHIFTDVETGEDMYGPYEPY